MAKGNKFNNGVWEQGTPEIVLAYQHDTPGQKVEEYVEGLRLQNEKKKEEKKKHFTQVFDNPLKGFPYNEEFEVTEIKEENLSEIKQQEVDALKKLSKEMQAVLKGYQKIARMGDKELTNTKYNKDYEAVLKSRDTILQLTGKVNTQKILNKEEVIAELEEDYKKVIKMFPRDKEWKKLITKHRRAIDALRNNNAELPKRVEDELLTWASQTGEVSHKDDAEDFIMDIIDEDLDEVSQSAMIQKAIDIATSMGGNMTGAVKRIEKIKRGLSKNKNVANALRLANESHFTKINVAFKEDLDENYRIAARHGMGTEGKKEARVGLELDYYDKTGTKYMGKIVKKDSKGYTVKDDKTGKMHTFVYHDRVKAKKFLQKMGDNVQESAEMVIHTDDAVQSNLVVKMAGKHGLKSKKTKISWSGKDGVVVSGDSNKLKKFMSAVEKISEGTVSEKFKPYLPKGSERVIDMYIQFRGNGEEKDFEKAKKMVMDYSKKHKLDIKDHPRNKVFGTPQEGSSAYKLSIYAKFTKDPNHDLAPLYKQLSTLKTAEDHGGGYAEPIKEETVSEAESRAQQAAIAISKKQKEKNESVMNTYRNVWEENLQEETIVYKVKGIQKPEMDKFNTSAKMMKLKVSFKKQGSDTHVTMTGTKKQLRDFDSVARGKSSYGDPSTIKHFDEK